MFYQYREQTSIIFEKIDNICVVIVIREYYSFKLFFDFAVYKTLVIFVYTSVSTMRILQLYNSFLLQSRNLIRSIFVVIKQEFCV